MSAIYAGFSVLYAEDDPLISATFSEFLKRRFDKVYLAKDGLEGLEAYKKYRPDIVITDISMPNLDGLDMSREIKSINKDAKIIITTAYSSEELFLKAIDIGVSSYVIKPIERDLLLRAIDSVVSVLSLQRDIDEKNKEIELLLNFQEDVVMVVSRSEIRAFNRSFKEFLSEIGVDSEIRSVEELGEFFLKEDGYVHSKESLGWIDMMLSTEESHKKIRTKDVKGHTKTYMLKHNKAGEEDLFVISFTDISDIEMEMYKIQRQADTDKLTGIFNRNRFDRLVEREIEHMRGTGKQTTLIMFDIDYFKKINDSYGHIVGDEVLKDLVKTVYKNIRFNDVFARWGGEEFVIMAVDSGVKEAMAFCEKLRTIIKESFFAQTIKLTCSFGVASLLDGDSVKKAIGRVDEALYNAKRNGRDRIEVV